MQSLNRFPPAYIWPILLIAMGFAPVGEIRADPPNASKKNSVNVKPLEKKKTPELQDADHDATLRTLTLNPGALSPGFSSPRKHYSSHVIHTVESVTVTATPKQPGATVTVNGNPVANVQASNPIHLNVGRNLIWIEVTDPDRKTKKVYTIKIIRSYPTPTWVRVRASSPWLPRDSAGELVFQNRMWLFGGYTPPLINDVWSSGDGANWTKVGNIPDESGVNVPINLVFDQKMWVVCNDGDLFSSQDGVNWTLVTDHAPWKGRYAAGGVVFAGKMWVMGGLGEGKLFHDVWSSTDGIHWTLETENAPWSRRQPFSMVAVYDNKIWLLGGGIAIYHPFKAYRDVWCSPDGKSWNRVTDHAPWPGRIWSASAVYRNRLWVLGGFRAEPTWNNFNDAWYSSNGKDWYPLKTETTWSPRHEISAYVFKDKLWVVAGNSWPLANDVWYLNIPGFVFVTQPVIEEFVTAQYSYRAHADFNQSGEKVQYRLVDSPTWLTVHPDTGLVCGTAERIGDFPVTLEAYDETGETTRQTYTLHVAPVN